MSQPNEVDSTDIRRAIDRLQTALEEVGDRFRELRRDRKQLRSRIDELELAELYNADLLDRQRELERNLSEREAFIVEQEQTISALRTSIDSDRQRGEQEQSEISERQRSELQAQVDEFHRQIQSLQTERARLEEQQHQLIAKLDVSTRDSGLARTRVAELEEQLDDARNHAAELEQRATTTDTELAGSNGETTIGADDRREMAQQIQQAIRLIDRHLEGT